MWNRGEFQASAAVLERAKDRLREFVPPELAERLSMAFENLKLVTRLDEIRLERALVKPPTGLLDALIVPMANVATDGQGLRGDTLSGPHYEEAFRKAGIGAPGDDPVEVAARVRASPVRAALVSALDDWAACAADRDQQVWVLAVVRRADPDPWRDLVRDPATWDKSEALRDLADRALVAEQSPHLLAVLGARLRARNLDANAFMTRVVSAYPTDFWANIEMGNALYNQSKPLEAVGYYRAALALRPQTLSLRYALGDVYLNLQRWDAAIAEYEQAVRLDADNAWCHNRLGFRLDLEGRPRRRGDRPHAGSGSHRAPTKAGSTTALDSPSTARTVSTRPLPNSRRPCDWSRRNAPSGGGISRFALLRRGRAAEAPCRVEGGPGGSSARARRLVRLRRAVPVPG